MVTSVVPPRLITGAGPNPFCYNLPTMKKLPEVVVIGGGTGTYTVLSGLRKYPVDLTAVVSMADSGGSNRILRDEFGILPTSDIRQALVALADGKGDREIFRELFSYRFHQGTGITGMTFGNLFMAALSDILGSQIEAIDRTAQILHLKGRVLPVTLDDAHLVARYENGHQAVGEHYIDEPRHDGRLKIVGLEYIPQPKAYRQSIRAIRDADLVILGPGDLYTSVVCNLIVGGVPAALERTKAKVVYVLNLMTRYGQTYGMSAKNHVAAVQKYGGNSVLDYVLVNDNGSLPRPILRKYAEENSFLVDDDLGEGTKKMKVVRSDLLSHQVVKKQPGDKLQRSMIRHDQRKLAKAIMGLL